MSGVTTTTNVSVTNNHFHAGYNGFYEEAQAFNNYETRLSNKLEAPSEKLNNLNSAEKAPVSPVAYTEVVKFAKIPESANSPRHQQQKLMKEKKKEGKSKTNTAPDVTYEEAAPISASVVTLHPAGDTDVRNGAGCSTDSNNSLTLVDCAVYNTGAALPPRATDSIASLTLVENAVYSGGVDI